MSKFPSLNSDKVIKILELLRVKGSHHIYRNYDTKRMTIVPYHKKDLPKGTLEEILKQAGIKKNEIKDLL
jgi:predicted RNA binding protein YcfA (HicA-like mRNA interferase family)